jgi:hypothetical protein
VYHVGNWEWEYAEPPPSEPQPAQELLAPGVEPTPWTPRGVDPRGSLDRIEEHSPPDEEPRDDTSEHYRIDSGVSGITQRMAATNISTPYEEYQSYQESYDGYSEKRSGKNSTYSDSRHTQNKKTKGKRGETSQGMEKPLPSQSS